MRVTFELFLHFTSEREESAFVVVAEATLLKLECYFNVIRTIICTLREESRSYVMILILYCYWCAYRYNTQRQI